MNFESIHIKNFLAVGEADLKLDPEGIVLITGANRDTPKGDSNGSGKTTILDAICWCLWGETTSGLAGDEVVHNSIGKDCVVALTLTDQGKTYVVSRHRKDSSIAKPNDLRLFVNGIEKTKKMAEMQSVIDNIIGFDFITFRTMMPGAGITAASLTDSKIKEILEKLLQTENLSGAYQAARDRLKELETSLSQETKLLDSTVLAWQNLTEEVAKLEELEAQQEAIKLKRENDHTVEIARLEAEIALIKNQSPPDKKISVTLRVEQEALEQQLTSSELAFKSFVKTCSDKEDSFKHDITVLETNLASLRDQLVITMSLNGECNTCNQEIDEEHKAKQIAYLEGLIASLEEKLSTLVRHREYNQSLYKEEKVRVSARHSELQDLISFKKSALEGLAREQERIAQLQASLSLLETSLQREQKLLLSVLADVQDFQSILKARAEQEQSLQEDLSKVNDRLLVLEQEKKLCSFWVEGFAPSGLRSLMLDHVTPILNDRAEHYSNILTDGEMKVTFTTKTQLKSGEDRDKFQIQVSQKHGSHSYKGSSKGEKARADLVIALALGDLATYRTAKQLPWRFLDEPFENIDDTGIEAVIQLLRDQKSKYKTIFIVTHKPAFKKLVSQKLTMVKEGGISRLELDTL
jgi:DNA repair exonuclease SbcCD ATPase subunit